MRLGICVQSTLYKLLPKATFAIFILYNKRYLNDFFQVFEDIMKDLHNSEDYDPTEWEKYSTIYTTYFFYNVGITFCEKTIETKEAKELLEMIKTVEFDVIVQDITLYQCLYALWEVRINMCICMYI